MCYNIFILGGVNMPATITHTVFTKDVYDILTPEIRGYLVWTEYGLLLFL